MKITACQKKIYDRLEREIRDRISPPGSFLPGERELADRFQVARGTIRKVLTHLEDAQLITRAHGKGTLICEPPCERNVLSFLIPSADYFAKYLEPDSRMPHVLFSVVEAVARYGWRVEILPFSPTNRRDDLDVGLFSHLNELSRVFIYDLWFEGIFQYLNQRNVKVGLLQISAAQAQIREENTVMTVIDYRNAVREAMFFLKNSGCRRIAFIGNYWNTPTNEKTIAYREAASLIGIQPMFFESGNDKPDEISRFCREQNIDGTLLDIHRPPHLPGRSLHEDLGLSKKIRTVFFFPLPGYLENYPQEAYIDNPLSQAVASMIPAILQKEWKPQKTILQARFHQRGSCPERA